MEDILKKIVTAKKKDLAILKRKVLLSLLKEAIKSSPKPLSFKKALKKGKLAVIAEVKKASPSRGLIAKDFKPVETALSYQNNSAAAISVLTEERFFLGSLGYLAAIKGKTKIPVLRKDFIVDEYQIYEARAAGADAVLLIVACLPSGKLKKFLRLTRSLGMDALVETRNSKEAVIAEKCGADIIGINNRDLRTFKVDITTTGKVLAGIKKNVVTVSESGISTPKDIKYLKRLGVNAVLIGESLMRSKNVGNKMKLLKNG